VNEREKKDLAKGKKSGQRGENVTIPASWTKSYIILRMLHFQMICFEVAIDDNAPCV
jgi:hypothetical protein